MSTDAAPECVSMPCPVELIGLIERYKQIPAGENKDDVADMMRSVVRLANRSTPPVKAPPTKLSETDQAIAECIDEYGPISAKEIATMLTEDGRFIIDQGVRDRMRPTLPLRLMGYKSVRGQGYVPPSASD